MPVNRVPFLAVGVFVSVVGLGAMAQLPTMPPPEEEAPVFIEVKPAEPPDGKWLKDAEGREYFLQRIPVTQARKESSTTLRTIWGMTVTYDRQDGDSYLVRYYKAEPLPSPEKPDYEAEGKLIDLLYRSPFETSDRITAKAFDSGLPQRGQWRDGFSIADMNEDGHPDLVFGPPRKSTSGPSVFLGDGKGEWTLWKEAVFPNLGYDYGTAVTGDLNGDGHQDIVYGVHLRGILAVAGDGKGKFADAGKGLAFAMPGKDAGFAFSSKAISITDWDGDGKPDIIALGEGPRLGGGEKGLGLTNPSDGVALYLNRGEAGFERVSGRIPEIRNFGETLVVTDLNNDRRLDIVTASGVLGRQDIVFLGGAKAMRPVQVDVMRPSAIVRDVAAGDLDGNGLVDLVIVYQAFEAASWRTAADIVFQFEGPRWSRVPIGYVKGNSGPSAVAILNLDGDKHPDIAIGMDDGTIWPFVSADENGFTRDNLIALPRYTGCEVSALRTKDLDGDGKQELVATFGTEDEPGRCSSGGGVGAWRFDVKPAKRP